MRRKTTNTGRGETQHGVCSVTSALFTSGPESRVSVALFFVTIGELWVQRPGPQPGSVALMTIMTSHGLHITVSAPPVSHAAEAVAGGGGGDAVMAAMAAVAAAVAAVAEMLRRER